MDHRLEKSIRFIVVCGTGIGPNTEYMKYTDALERYKEEKSVPSYMGTGHKRQVSIIKRTVIHEDFTPKQY